MRDGPPSFDGAVILSNSADMTANHPSTKNKVLCCRSFLCDAIICERSKTVKIDQINVDQMTHF